MARGLAATIVIGLALGLYWFAAASENEDVLRATRSARIVERVEHGRMLAPRESPDSVGAASMLRGSPARSRESIFASLDEELAQAHWVEGRVLFPVGTPPDDCTAVAQGRAFSDGTIQRCRVGTDGRFRVAFSRARRPAGSESSRAS